MNLGHYPAPDLRVSALVAVPLEQDSSTGRKAGAVRVRRGSAGEIPPARELDGPLPVLTLQPRISCSGAWRPAKAGFSLVDESRDLGNGGLSALAGGEGAKLLREVIAIPSACLHDQKLGFMSEGRRSRVIPRAQGEPLVEFLQRHLSVEVCGDRVLDIILTRMPLRIEYVSSDELRRLFAEQKCQDRAYTGELLEHIVANRAAPSSVGEPEGTRSQMVSYREAWSGREVARAHRYLRPDWTLGASGQADPKIVRIAHTLYKERRTES
jgi:hypothetical protein